MCYRLPETSVNRQSILCKRNGEIMSKKQKLIDRLKSRPKDFEYDEAESLLRSLGFNKSDKGKTSGSRVKFNAGDVLIDLHKPHPHKELKPYQVNKIIDALEKEGFI